MYIVIRCAVNYHYIPLQIFSIVDGRPIVIPFGTGAALSGPGCCVDEPPPLHPQIPTLTESINGNMVNILRAALL